MILRFSYFILNIFFNRRFLFFVLTSLLLVFIQTHDVFALPNDTCGYNSNSALRTLCDIIVFLQGRIGRALAIISIMMAAWEFQNGSIKWQSIATLMVALSMFYAPKTVALYILPDYIQGLQGSGYDPDRKYSPDELLTCVCPDLK